MRPMGARVLKFDSAVGAEGSGIDAFGVDEYSRLSAAALRNCLPALTVILSASEESRYMPYMNHLSLNTSRLERAAACRSESSQLPAAS